MATHASALKAHKQSLNNRERNRQFRSRLRGALKSIRAAIDEALAAKETGEERVILFNYCGHGFLDLAAYDDFNHGRLVDE